MVDWSTRSDSPFKRNKALNSLASWMEEKFLWRFCAQMRSGVERYYLTSFFKIYNICQTAPGGIGFNRLTKDECIFTLKTYLCYCWTEVWVNADLQTDLQADLQTSRLADRLAERQTIRSYNVRHKHSYMKMEEVCDWSHPVSRLINSDANAKWHKAVIETSWQDRLEGSWK